MISTNKISEYVDRTAELIDLPIDAEHRPGVISNLERIAVIAQLLLEFPLTDEIEISPVFDPGFDGEPTPEISNK